MDSKVAVINADDLGFSADINAAIQDAHQAGRVTNASLMVDGKAVEDALGVAARNPRLGVGLHLDLCPAVGFYSLPYAQVRQNLNSADGRDVVAREVERQIRRFQDFGLEFTHLDGHRHFHALPEIFETVVQVASSFGLRTIRFTKDWILPRTPSVYWEPEMYHRATAMLLKHGILYPAHFIYNWMDYSWSAFQPGLNELMVHVGYEDEFYLREYRLVTSEEFGGNLEKTGLQLKSYREVALAQAGS